MKIQGWMPRSQVCFSAMLIACALVMTPSAKADPIMDASTFVTTNEYYAPHPGLEIAIEYDVFNNSAAGDINNMLSFTLSAGSNQGVYATTQPSGWTAAIGDTNTTFLGNGNYIAPGNDDIFNLFSTSLLISHTGYATATAKGTYADPAIPFNQVNNLDVPMMAIPEPGVLGFGVLAMGLAFLCRHRLRSARRSS